MNVLYFTVVPLVDAGNGGSICCRNHVERLASDPGIAKLVCLVAGPPERKPATEAFLSGLGLQGGFLPIHPLQVRPSEPGFWPNAKLAASVLFQMDWELPPLNQRQVQDGIDAAIREHAIDTLIFDYHASTRFVALPRTDVRTLVIGLNREGDFYADRVRLGQTHHGRVTGRVSVWRARRWERRVNASVDKVVTIGPFDMPRRGVRSPATCITPFLDPKPRQWRYTQSNKAFFVGNYGHYPNRVAIDWIVQRLARALLDVGSGIRLVIVGASEQQVPQEHRHPNVEFLGIGDAALVETLFQSCDVMVCPVENDYGVKFKALQALSYGTPLLASRQVLLGLQFLSGMPDIVLSDPKAAAAKLVRLVGNPGALHRLHDAQNQQLQNHAQAQTGVWSRTISSIAPPQPR